ncbi:hypothetical protein [Dactylosporangium sp. NPDC048998]|uniref:hypothetical protein n=1 Tax=Dactylosporangium sp. NPDC048998 TaxID=3363976 RepID=UPI0037206B37
MSDNSSWWLLVPCGIVTIASTVAIVSVVRLMRRATRPVLRSFNGEDAHRQTVRHPGSPLDANWTPDNPPYNAADPGAHHSSHSSHGSSSHGHDHWQSHGHTIHHDSGSSWSDSGSSSWSDSGSSGGDSGSSHHHHSD